MSIRRFRILSLDGGGIKGVFTASVLATLEEETGTRLQEHFDLIVGTSTGGILALGLGLGLSPKDLLSFYSDRGSQIFPATDGFSRTAGKLRQIFRPKLDVQPLSSAIDEILGDKLFGDATSRLVIPTYDAVEGRIFMFKTAHHPRFTQDGKIPAKDVALATSAAPTFFAAASSPTRIGSQYVDGGVWANNPSLVGIVEALSFLNIPRENIDVLNIGTTTEPFNISKHARSGVARWNTGLIDLLMAGQAEAALAQASLLVDGRLHRIDHTVVPGEFTMDDARSRKISQLIELGRGQATKKGNLETVRKVFLDGRHVEPFVPSTTHNGTSFRQN